MNFKRLIPLYLGAVIGPMGGIGIVTLIPILAQIWSVEFGTASLAITFYMIPFIWAGNAILVFSFKHFKLKKKCNYTYTLAVGSLLKGAFLFLSALALYKLSIIPVVFLTAMGFMQVVTAISGGIAAYGIHHAKKSLSGN